MKEEKEINCLYGSEHQKSILYVYDGWYVCDGSVNVNRTNQLLEDGVDIELIENIDVYTSCNPIESLQELIDFIEED